MNQIRPRRAFKKIKNMDIVIPTGTTTPEFKLEVPKPIIPQKVVKQDVLPLENKNTLLSGSTYSGSIRNINDIFYEDKAVFYDGLHVINPNQVSYLSSTKEKCNSAIPSSLWQSTMKALDDLNNDILDVKRFLQDKMSWNAEKLESYLSPEQQDVLALMINNFDNGKNAYERGFLLGDTTGFGKGRPLMAYAAYSKRNGVFPIIFTIQENLFSNLWADIQDMNLENDFKRPFPINAGAVISDTRSLDNKKLFQKIKPAQMKEIIASGDIPDEFGIIFITYSTLNQLDSQRMEFFRNLMHKKDTTIILDESQAIVEMSAATSINVGELLHLSYSNINSSATSARHIENMSSYSHIYPWLEEMTTFESNSFSKEKKLWLSALSVEKAVSDGRMLRREHDMSGLKMDMILPEENIINESRRISDEFAGICGKIIDFHGLVADAIDKLNEPVDSQNGITSENEALKLPDMEYKVLPVFQRLHPVSRQLLACMMAKHIANRAIDALKNGKKPFIVMDMTMEAAAVKIMGNNFSKNDGEDEDIEEDNNDYAQKPMTLKDLLILALDKTCKYSFKKRGSRGKFENAVIDDSLLNGFSEYYNNVLNEINTISELPASPMDTIKDMIEAEGQKLFSEGKIDKPWSICEISGRSRRVENNKYVPINDPGKNALISGFNSGYYDGIIASRKASTGLSAHSSNKFIDTRPRLMIEGIGCDNPIERKQMFGRIDRRGQIHKPEYESINIGTPYNLIKIATDNAKSIELSTSVSASGEAGLLADVPNLLSPVGNDIARDILSRNHNIADKMRINISEDNDIDYASAMFRRSFVLPVQDQEKIINEFMEKYEIRMKDAIHDTVNDLGEQWEVVSQNLIEPGKSGLKDGVFLSKIEKNVIYDSFTSRNMPIPQAVSDDIYQRLDDIERNKKSYLMPYKEPFIKSVEAALYFFNNSPYLPFSRNRVGLQNEKMEYGLNFLQNARRGASVIMRDKYGCETPAIISNVKIPDNDNIFNWHQYVFSYVIPGEKKVYRMGLDTIMNSNGTYRLEKNRDMVLSAFDEKAPGSGKEIKYILEGHNPLALVSLSQRSETGLFIKWSDEHNIIRSSIMIAPNEIPKLMKTPLKIWEPDIATSLLKKGHTIFCGNGAGKLSIKRDGYSYKVELPYKASEKRAYNKLTFILANLTKQAPDSEKFILNSDILSESIEKIMKEYPLHYNVKDIDYVLELTQDNKIQEPNHLEII